jgi:hypothetical protein
MRLGGTQEGRKITWIESKGGEKKMLSANAILISGWDREYNGWIEPGIFFAFFPSHCYP